MTGRFGGLAVACALCAAGFAAQAEETHQIDMIGDVLFPPVVQARVGDTITFFNREASHTTVEATDQSWSVGPVAQGTSASITVTADMTLTFAYPATEMESAVIVLVSDGE